MCNGYESIVSGATAILMMLGWFLIGIITGLFLSRKGARKQRRSPKSDGKHKKGNGIELYVGNLSYDIGDRDLRKAFAVFGKVNSARIIINKFNGKSKGYGFVEMKNRKESAEAVSEMNGSDFKGRRIVVNEAKSRSKR